jgi:hypothetical protein
MLVRMAVVAGLVLVLAQPQWHRAWGRWFAGSQSHHVVILDDSFSMSDRGPEGSTAFDLALAVVRRIGKKIVDDPAAGRFSLVRTSRASGDEGGSAFDLGQEQVDSDLHGLLARVLGGLEPSEFAAGPAAGLAGVARLLEGGVEEPTVVYVVSDFRSREWSQPQEIVEHLKDFSSRGLEVHLVDCAAGARDNLALTFLAARPGIQAADVPMFIDVTVANYGGEAVRNLSVLLERDGQPRPALVFDRIAPGESETRHFQDEFGAGHHYLVARLAPDGVAADNARYALATLPDKIPILIVEGDPARPDTRYLRDALAPGGSVATGLSPRIEPPSYLARGTLDAFAAVYLVNVDRLDPAAVESLETYVAAGGGLGFFLGEACQQRFYTDVLYRDGQGLFPLPLAGRVELFEQAGADIEPLDHPVFKSFLNQRNSFLGGVRVAFYFGAPPDWSADDDPSVRVMARLRNAAPLAVEKSFGRGRVAAVLTTSGPDWNNWCRNPSYVLMALELQSYLANAEPPPEPSLVGSPIVATLDEAEYQQHVRLIVPRGDGASQIVAQDGASTPEGWQVRFVDTPRAGIYSLQLETVAGEAETRPIAYNVEPDEGDLAKVSSEYLAEVLRGVDFKYRTAAEFQADAQGPAGSQFSMVLLYVLAAVLVGEQALSYFGSYHPSSALEHGR